MNRLYTTDALQRMFPDLKFWDYGTDFNQLWRMKPLGTDHAIVVWGDTPGDPDVRPVATEQYLTPFDWAIAACSRNRTLQVTVLDLRPREHDQAGYAALSWLRTQKQECVPWLRRLLMYALLDISDADCLRSLLTTFPTTTHDALTVEPRNALRALPVSQRDLTSDASHHAIANLVGPLLLLRNLSPEALNGGGSANHREALRQVLLAAGLAPKKKVGTHETLHVAKLGDVRFVLVDDQWHHGWAEWLSERLDLPWDGSRANAVRVSTLQEPQCVAGMPNAGVSLWVSGAPQWILERASKALVGKERDARLGLRLTDGGGECGEILLLDLRLFPSGSHVDKTFASEIAQLARRFTADGPLPPFTDAELNGVEVWSSSNENDPKERGTLLTLLPRLLAHTDLSLPIVLFSSTGRRDIVGKLSGYLPSSCVCAHICSTTRTHIS